MNKKPTISARLSIWLLLIMIATQLVSTSLFVYILYYQEKEDAMHILTKELEDVCADIRKTLEIDLLWTADIISENM